MNSLPDGWRAVKIQELTTRTKPRDPSKNPDRTFRYVDVSSVSNTLFKIETATEMLGAEAPSRARKEIKTKDVLFATVRPTLKRIALVPQELDGEIASTGYCVLRPQPDKVIPEFLYHSLLTNSFVKAMGALERGVSYPAIRDSDVLSASILLPPLSEQRLITHVLTTVQTAIEQQAQLIALTRELKSSLMRKLFTEGLHGEKQKETEIGLVPESWKVSPLDELLTLTQYGLSVRGEDSGDYGILRMTNQKEGKITADKMQFITISKDNFEKYQLQYGDILFNRTNSLELVGRTAIFDIKGDYVFASYLIRLKTDEKRLNSFFLNHFLNWDESQRRLKSIALRAVSQSNISATRLRTFHVPVPSLEEQSEINESINTVIEKIGIHRHKKELLEEFFRTLLHQLMTGQIRVPTDITGL